MKERPILFSAPMVRALLDGSKTQTRRIVKGQAPEWATFGAEADIHGREFFMVCGEQEPSGLSPILDGIYCPYGQPGDRLWVRESHAQVLEVDIPAGRPAGPIGTMGSPARPDWKSRYVYRADGEMPNVQWHHLEDSQPVRWTPSIHMPRAASRILLEVVSVRVERLNAISSDDCRAEGIRQCDGIGTNAQILDLARRMGTHTDEVLRYATLWEQINGAGSWDANPWVWVVEFNRVAP